MKKPPKNNESIARKNILRRSEEAKGKKVKGYDFNKGFSFEGLMESFGATGMQADNFFRATKIIEKMIKEKAFIYLGYTSNMVTSGLRDIFRYLAEHNLVQVIVTTAGGIEEDIIKCLGDFKLGSFKASGKKLRERGINRAGNVFIPNSRYCDFEDFIIPVFSEFYKRQKATGKAMTGSELIWKLGEKIGKTKKGKESIYYWCWKNKIRVFCPAITDGSIGDMIYFFKSKNPSFLVDVAEDIWEINNSSLGRKKTGIIVLGSGIIKHHICNANMFRNGTDYAVYINNAIEADGSDSGALPEEAVSWGKVLPKSSSSDSVKVFGDAILLFPFIVAKVFAKKR